MSRAFLLQAAERTFKAGHPSPATPVPAKILSGLDGDLRVLRDCIRSAKQAMREQKRRKNLKLVRHWENMLAILRDSERDLLAIKGHWEQRAPN